MVEEKHADPLASRTSSPPRRASSKPDSDSSDDRPLNMPRPTPGKKRPQRPTSTPKATPSPTPPIADEDSEKEERPDFPQQKLGTDLPSLFRIDGEIVPRDIARGEDAKEENSPATNATSHSVPTTQGCETDRAMATCKRACRLQQPTINNPHPSHSKGQ